MKRRQHEGGVRAGTDLAGQMERHIGLEGREHVASHGKIGHVGLMPARAWRLRLLLLPRGGMDAVALGAKAPAEMLANEAGGSRDQDL